MHCKANRIVIPIRSKQANLPIVYNYFLSNQEKKEIIPHIRYAMAYSNLSTLELFGDIKTSKGMISGKNGLRI